MSTEESFFEGGLMGAVRQGDFDEIVELAQRQPQLIDQADPTTGLTPLAVAASRGHHTAVAALLSLGSLALETPDRFQQVRRWFSFGK